MKRLNGMDTASRIIATRWFALVVIACVAFAIYSNTWHVPFVFDDYHTIEHSEKIRDLSHFSSPRAFLGPRAVVDFTFALNYRIGKLDVFGYHLVNVLIHCVNGFVVYFLSLALLASLPWWKRPQKQDDTPLSKARRKRGKDEAVKETTRREPGGDDTPRFSPHFIALFAALVFVAHPLQTQAVTYIAQRYTSLAAFFYMGAILFYLKARTPSLGLDPSSFRLQPLFFYLLAFLFGVLAFQSKQNAASLPLAIVLVEVICIYGSRRGWARGLLWVAPFFALFGAFVLYAMGLFGGAGIGDMLEDVSRLSRETELVTRWSYLFTQFNVLVIYLRLIVFPAGQNLDYYYLFRTSFFDGYTPLAFAFLAALAILAIWKHRRYPLFTFAIFWFFVTLSVESSVIPISDPLFEHRLYVPLFGFALLAAWFPFWFLPKRRTLAVLICVSIIVALGAATYFRNRVWKDDLTLWTDVLEKSPQNPRAALNLGNVLGKRGRYDEAMRLYNQILRSNPDSAKTHFNIGLLHEKQGKKVEAISSYRRVLQSNPRYADAHYNLANIMMDQGDFKGAEKHYSEVLRINPGNTKARGNLGIIMTRQGNLDDALKHLHEAVRRDPKDAMARNNLGGILETRGDLEGAALRYAEALALNPGNPGSRENLARVLGKVGDPALASRCYREVLRSFPENAGLHMDFGITLSRLGDSEGAIAQFSEVVRIEPKDPKARYNLGLALFKWGKMGEAAKQYQESLKLQPQNHRAQYNLALALYGSGDFAGAIGHFEAAMRQDPALKAQASYDIARAYARQDKVEESLQWLKSAVAAGFKNWDGLKKDKDLENIKTTPDYRKITKGH